MTRTKLQDLETTTTHDELIELGEEQLTEVCGGGNGATGATNVVTGGGDVDSGPGWGGGTIGGGGNIF